MPDVDRVREEATFRGVPFHAQRRTRSGGRRGPTHEFPQRDQPDAEDTGRKARKFDVEGLVVGADYMLARDRLVEALEAYGPGDYVDPWGHTWSVVVRDYSVSEGQDEGGLARLKMTFEEAGAAQYPVADIDTVTGVDVAATALEAAAVQSFTRDFTLDGQPGFIREAALADAAALVTEVQRAGSLVAEVVALTQTDPRILAQRLLSNIVATGAFGEFAPALLGLYRATAAVAFDGVRGLGQPKAAREVFVAAAAAGESWAAVPQTTRRRQRQADNQAALVTLNRRLALAQEGRAFSAVPWESHEQAMAERDATVSRVDAAVRVAGGARPDDRAFQALSGLRAALAGHVEATAPALPHLRTIDLAVPLPAPVVAHKVYGDARRMDEVIRRNRAAVRHPGFIPSAIPLEVLSD